MRSSFWSSARTAGLALIFGPKYWFDSKYREKFEPPEPEVEDRSNRILTVVAIGVTLLSILVTVIRIRREG